MRWHKCAPLSLQRNEDGTKESEAKKEEEDGARRVPRPERVLDHTDSILAVGQRRRGGQDRRSSADGRFQTRARRVDGAFEQHGSQSRPTQSSARSASLAADRDGRQIRLTNLYEKRVHMRKGTRG